MQSPQYRRNKWRVDDNPNLAPLILVKTEEGICLRARINEYVLIVDQYTSYEEIRDIPTQEYVKKLYNLKTDLDIGFMTTGRVHIEECLIDKMFDTEELKKMSFLKVVYDDYVIDINRRKCYVDTTSLITGVSSNPNTLTAYKDGLPFFIKEVGYTLKPWQKELWDDIIVNKLPILPEEQYINNLLSDNYASINITRKLKRESQINLYHNLADCQTEDELYQSIRKFSPQELLSIYYDKLSKSDIQYFSHLIEQSNSHRNISVMLYLHVRELEVLGKI